MTTPRVSFLLILIGVVVGSGSTAFARADPMGPVTGTWAGECQTTEDCDRGAYCQGGECTNQCPSVFAPVCGDDFKTYFNTCAARARHVDVQYAGSCVATSFPSQICADDDDCEVGYCDDNRACTTLCPYIFRPVCGVDGHTYPNACEARVAHVEVAHEEACEDISLQRPSLCETNPEICAGLENTAPRQPKFLFPGQRLAVGMYWSHPGDHVAGNNQDLGTDLSALRFDGNNWVHLREGTDESRNDDWLIYGAKVFAIADGEVVKCWRNAPENLVPGEAHPDIARIPGGGNELWVRLDDGSHLLYAHLQPGTIPRELCPKDKELFDSSNEIEIPAGDEPQVKKGEFLGRVGNSGRSSAPHLHLHRQQHNAPASLRLYGAWIKPTVGATDSPLGWRPLGGAQLPNEQAVIQPHAGVSPAEEPLCPSDQVCCETGPGDTCLICVPAGSPCP